MSTSGSSGPLPAYNDWMETSAVFPVQPQLARQTVCMPRGFCSSAHLHRFQQDSSSVLEEASSTWLKGEMTPRASGSPRGRPRGLSRGTLAASVTSEEGDEQEAAEEELREEQAATLVQSLQQLEQVVVAGESLCRLVNSLPPYQGHTPPDCLPPYCQQNSSKLPVNNAYLHMQPNWGVRVTVSSRLLFVLAQHICSVLTSA